MAPGVGGAKKLQNVAVAKGHVEVDTGHTKALSCCAKGNLGHIRAIAKRHSNTIYAGCTL